jgi:GT2 family glycosyltransferase
MTPEVTAVITTHVRPTSVYEALASVRAETHADFEIVIVDDGGAFVAPAHVADFAIRLVRGSSLGVGMARNLGLEAAQGQYVIFLDDDDVAMPHRIACLVQAARDQQASLCFGMTRRVVDGTAEVLEDVPTHLLSSGAVDFCDLLTCAPHVNAVLARTEALRAVGGFDTGAAHFDDWSAWLRMADRGALMWCISETVADWRIHDQGLSGQVLRGSAMKARILALFERLSTCLSDDNARTVTAAMRIVQSAQIVTYDDYADTMALARAVLQGGGACFCGPLYAPYSDHQVG